MIEATDEEQAGGLRRVSGGLISFEVDAVGEYDGSFAHGGAIAFGHDDDGVGLPPSGGFETLPAHELIAQIFVRIVLE